MASCISCSREVTSRQHGISCDVCDRWQHRVCGTGISLVQYRQMVRGERMVTFTCQPCREGHEQELEKIHEFSASVENDDTAELMGSTSNARDITEESFMASASFHDPVAILERSLDDARRPSSPLPDRPLTFEVLRGASQKGKDLLIDSYGYTYTVKDIRGSTTHWRCSTRNKTQRCPAAVREKGDTFFSNDKSHIHPINPSSAARVMTAVKAKKDSEVRLFESAKTIVEEILKDYSGPLPDLELLARRVNRHRQRCRTMKKASPM